MRRSIFLLTFLLVAGLPGLYGQTADSLTRRLLQRVYAVQRFGRSFPQEKVYLHFDNTGYYQGDDIWFQGYVVDAGHNRPTPLSRTLYVELLNPGGEIIAKQILPIRDGRAHGNFSLTRLPFYAGFYEVRAYTRYMLNFGEGCVFSRLLPVFEKPETPGDYTQKEIRPYAVYKYLRLRKRQKKQKKLNLAFYPEGGRAVEGLPCRVAFEATDAYGNPVDVSGQILNHEEEPQARFASLHEGRGTFTYTPRAEEEYKAVVEWQGKTYRFRLPEAQATGVTWTLDAVTQTDSLSIRIQKHPDLPADILGMALLCRGQLKDFYLVETREERPIDFRADIRDFPPGVAQAVLFDADGQILADRLFFAGQPDTVHISVRTDKNSYQPYDSIRVELCVHDAEGKPVQAPLSVSVRDALDEVAGRHSLLTDLLLMSEIKGYVRQPAWYFEADDSLHRRALDHLLMVQGWRRYDWNREADTIPFRPECPPEQGIEVRGQVVSMARSKPQPGIDLTAALMKRDTTGIDSTQTIISTFITDSLGRFAFRTDVQGRWNLVLAATKNGKKKGHRIVLDRVFSPAPRTYPLAEMQIEVDEKATSYADTLPAATAMPEVNIDSLLQAYEDSLHRTGITEKIHHLKEVVVTAKKRSRAHDVYEARRKSVAYYDVAAEMDDITDRNKFVGDDFNEMMVNINPHFQIYREPQGRDLLLYNGRLALCVINYKRVNYNEMDLFKYQLLTLESIKSIYITEDTHTMLEYADIRFTPFGIHEAFGCAVLIETYPEKDIPARAAKGVRKTRLEGYSQVKEFYQPDYSVLPPEEDYRRTLYWNPEVQPDEQGRATLRLYNNSRCRRPRIAVETLTEDGSIGTTIQ